MCPPPRRCGREHVPLRVNVRPAWRPHGASAHRDCALPASGRTRSTTVQPTTAHRAAVHQWHFASCHQPARHRRFHSRCSRRQRCSHGWAVVLVRGMAPQQPVLVSPGADGAAERSAGGWHPGLHPAPCGEWPPKFHAATHMTYPPTAPSTCVMAVQQTEAVEEDDPADTVYGLEPGRRLVEEDYNFRARVSARR